MENDPIIQEIRDIRDAHAAQFDYDLQAIYEDLKQKETQSDREYVNFSPRPVEKLEPSTKS